MTDVKYSALDPGIVDTVRLLRDEGFNTTDSGDGVSKPPEGRTFGDLAHVVCVVRWREDMLAEADRLHVLLGDTWHVEANYSTRDRVCLLVATKGTV